LRTRVKICGITRPEDAIAAVKHGADAIGLVFYGPSPRNVSIEMAADIVSVLPPFVSKVGLFVNAPASEIETVLRRVSLDCLQFHGDESATDCAQINLPYYKAIRVKDDTNLLQYASYYAQAKALLLDTYSEASVGGTGQVFDWKLIPENIGKPLILAGGLTADNVAAAIRQVNPYAVDVSGGVEASKGIKDEIKIASFMREVDQLRS
jgi:phosphoribosylanthranilate isomerase